METLRNWVTVQDTPRLCSQDCSSVQKDLVLLHRQKLAFNYYLIIIYLLLSLHRILCGLMTVCW